MSNSGSQYVVLGDDDSTIDLNKSSDEPTGQVDAALMETETHEVRPSPTKTSEEIPKGKSKQLDEITLNVSHEELAASLRPFGQKGVSERIRVFGPNGELKRSKEKSVNEFINKLEAHPISLKPGRSNLRQTLDKVLKEKRGVAQTAPSVVETRMDGNSFIYPPKPTVAAGKATRTGLHETRPPDLPHPASKVGEEIHTVQPSPTIPAQKDGRHVDVPKSTEELMHEEDWSDCQSEEAMDIATPTV